MKSDIIDIADRRELFVDHYLVDRLDGARLHLHEPVPADTAITFDAPWEGPGSGYCTVIHDGDRYRLYYRAWDTAQPDAPPVTCYAESRDGRVFERPELGLHEWEGRRENNIILTGEGTHNFCPFLDANPEAPESERYKALGRVGGKTSRLEHGLAAFVSPDGIHWSMRGEGPVITKGKFDSQNVPLWSRHENCYVSYYRVKSEPDAGFRSGGGVRTIARAVSDDFIHWSDPVLMDFGDTPPEQLYTNQTMPYYRAPQIYVALPGRFMPGRQVLTDAEGHAYGIVSDKKGKDYWHDCSDGCLMTSRGGSRYDRTFMEAFVRPGLDRRNWSSRCNYPALGVVPTGEDEMSIYVERYNAQPGKFLQRLTLRPDGFASVRAPYGGGEMLTRPFSFQGSRLELNVATGAAGGLRLALLDAAGKPLDGCSRDDGPEIVGDELAHIVQWSDGPDIGRYAGTPVRLHAVMRDADLYALRFC